MADSAKKVGATAILSSTLPALQTSIRLGLGAVLIVTYLCYAATLHFGFVYDDVSQIVDNPRIHSVRFLPGYFVNEVWAHQAGRPQNLYRPLFLVWLLANYKSFALHAGYWHFMAVWMHLLMVFVVYLLARRLLPVKTLGALVACALFAVHPSHVEAVAWISGATEPLAGVLFITSFLCYLSSRCQGPHYRGWRIASMLLGAGAMLAKETAVVLPAVIFAYEWLADSPRETAATNPRSRRIMSEVLPYVLLAAGYFILRIVVLHGMAHSFSDVPVSTSMLTWPWLLSFYISELLVPAGLGVNYDVKYASGLDVVVPLLVLAALAFGVWWWSKKSGSRLPLFLASWFLLTLFPALLLFLLVWRYDNVHDRYLYLPSVALAIFLGHVVTTAAERLSHSKKLWLWCTTITVLVFLAISTYRQTLSWRDNVTLFTRGAAVAPHNLMAKLNLASALFANRQYEEAFNTAQQALAIDPNSPLALTDVAQAAYYHGDYPAALRYYSRALSLAPPTVDQIHYLSLTMIKLGQFRQAFLLLRTGLHSWPEAPGFHGAMGEALAGMGQWDAAYVQYELELKLNPADAEIQSKKAEAETHLAKSMPQPKQSR
jgi:tetratricopeptide (TPR) repeat protein